MATIWKTAKGELIHHGPDVEPVLSRELFGQAVEMCDFCGRPRATAWWQAHQAVISVCRECAVVALPALIADAVIGEAAVSEAGLRVDIANVLRRFCAAARLALARVAEVAARVRPSRRKWPPGTSVN
jgi:hypothetical protein